MNVTESKLVVHKTMSDSSLELPTDDERLTQIVATNQMQKQKFGRKPDKILTNFL